MANILNSRPKQCPMAGQVDSHREVLERLRENLRSFKCYEDNETALSLVDEQLASLSQVESEGEEGEIATTDNAEANRVLHGVSSISGVLDGLVDLQRRRRCRDDLNKKSFLGRLADAVLGIAQLGVLNDENGLEIAGGGILLSSLIHAIDEFFSRRYQWDNYEDRILFDKLNCTFYDIRRTLNEQGLFRLGTEQNYVRKRELQEKFEELSREVSRLQREVALAQEKALAEENDFREKSISHEARRFNELVEKLLPALPPASSPSSGLLVVSTRSSEILSLLDSISWEGAVAEYLLPRVRTILGNLSMESYLSNVELDFSSEMELLTTLFIYYKDFHQKRLASVEKEWESAVTQSKSFKELREKETLLVRVQEEVAKVEQELASSIKRSEKALYRANDSGGNQLMAIYQFYNETVDKIYGRNSKGFIKVLKKKLTTAYEAFSKEYEVFEERGYFEQLPSSLLQLNEACSRAEILVQRWGEANGWGQYAFDFFVTNFDIFHDVRGNGRLFGGTRRDLRNDAYSALYAKALIDDHYLETWGDRESLEGEMDQLREQYPVDYHEKDSIGVAMLEIYQSAEKAQRVEGFLQEKCSF